MEKVRNHAAVTLIHPVEHSKDLVFGIYDDAYPVTAFTGHYTPVGGNANGHSSPLDTIIRELHEELQDEHISEETIGAIANLKDKRSYALNESKKIGENAVSLNLRRAFRDAVIGSLTPLRDYFVNVDGSKINSKDKNRKFIYSFFVAGIDNALFYEIADELGKGLELRNEGLTRVIGESELKRGSFRGAWGAAAIVGDILRLDIPEYDWIHVEPLGNIRNSYQDYKKDFSYTIDPELKPT